MWTVLYFAGRQCPRRMDVLKFSFGCKTESDDFALVQRTLGCGPGLGILSDLLFLQNGSAALRKRIDNTQLRFPPKAVDYSSGWRGVQYEGER